MQQEVISLPKHQKIYFASDFHLGASHHQATREREHRILAWLNQIKEDAHAIYLLGDIFDFWFEYKNVIPKGFARLQGKLAELHDEGIAIHLAVGNHDMWMQDYFQQEIGARVYYEPIEIKVGKQIAMIGHGDGLGAGEKSYKRLKKIYTSSIARWLFSQLHPDFGIRFAQGMSRRSRMNGVEKEYKGKEQEQLFMYCKKIEKHHHHDFYIFGHRHLPLDLAIGQNSRYINLGDWMSFNTYVAYDGVTANLIAFEPPS